MTDFRGTISRLALASCLVFAAMPARSVGAQDLSMYRKFQLGTTLPAVAKQAGFDPAQATLIHSRPALVQQFDWDPRSFSSPPQSEAVKQVVFTFYNGELFRIAIDYDSYQIMGLTASDMIEAISANYGIAAKPAHGADVVPALYGDQQEVLAEWQDAEYRFDLIRGSYGPSFRLVGVLKRLEAPFQVTTVEAARLDAKEAPQREAERVAKAGEAERAALEQNRLENKPKFRP
jgi:hypothetical protein